MAGLLVKLVGSGIGLAAEAYHHNKQSKSRSRNNSDDNVARSNRDLSPNPPSYEEAQYAEVPHEEGQRMIARGEAVPASEKERSYFDQKKGLHEDDDDDDDDDSSIEDDEEDWALDEAGDNDRTPLESPPAYSDELDDAQAKSDPEGYVNKLIAQFNARHPEHRNARPGARIPCPVIVPQRRPNNKKRGFVRAYAPVLAESGIDQRTFLDFLKTFHKASQADPWIKGVMIAAAITGFVPEVAAQVVSTVVQVAAGTAEALQSAHRKNSFLDHMNEVLFKPHGLYALVMCYKPDNSQSMLQRRLPIFTKQDLNLNQTIAKYDHSPNAGEGSSGGFFSRETLKGIRNVSGTTRGALEMPEAAPLIFPSLDDQLEAVASDPNSSPSQQKTSKWKSSGKFMADYMDRRAQANYAGSQNAHSNLASPENYPKFNSRFADPNHPVNNGSLISFITGGNVNPKAYKQERRSMRREFKAQRRGFASAEERDMARERRGRHGRGGLLDAGVGMMQGGFAGSSSSRSPVGPRTPYGATAGRGRRQRRPGLVKRLMQEDVLYLMVVNLPTEQELAIAKAQLEAMKNSK